MILVSFCLNRMISDFMLELYTIKINRKDSYMRRRKFHKSKGTWTAAVLAAVFLAGAGLSRGALAAEAPLYHVWESSQETESRSMSETGRECGKTDAVPEYIVEKEMDSAGGNADFMSVIEETDENKPNAGNAGENDPDAGKAGENPPDTGKAGENQPGAGNAVENETDTGQKPGETGQDGGECADINIENGKPEAAENTDQEFTEPEDENNPHGYEEKPSSTDTAGAAGKQPGTAAEAENIEQTVETETQPGREEPENSDQEPSDMGDRESSKEGEAEGAEVTKKADFRIQASAIPETAKAGEILLYEVTVENTGELPLEALKLYSVFGQSGQNGQWEETPGLITSEGNAVLDHLEPGEETALFLRLPLTEAQETPVKLKLMGEAENAADAEEISGEGGKLVKTVEVLTEITPLKADFQVTKTADRETAAAGDTVYFQICIRNTGERTLHSVLTTEKFQAEDIPVRFLEKEGIQLNQNKTKALIPQIGPGEAVSLRAAVELPEKVESRELINEVSVVTAETGEREVSSRAELQVYGPPEQEPSEETDIDAETEPPSEKSSRVSENPKTGDGSRPALWCLAAFLSALAAGFLGRGFWRRFLRKLTKTKD